MPQTANDLSIVLLKTECDHSHIMFQTNPLCHYNIADFYDIKNLPPQDETEEKEEIIADDSNSLSSEREAQEVRLSYLNII